MPAPSGIDSEKLAAAAAGLRLRLVVLFGSRAGGAPAPRADSDWDIAALGCEPGRLLDCQCAISEAIPGASIDLVRLEDADPLLRQEVMAKAVLLYGDPDLFCEYRAYAYQDYHDSADLFALEQTLFRKKMARLKERLGDQG